ncbi:MAG: hypothetical protein M1826_002351 [Phylliscum demangeonii]|nr:MAG: hypothetical protein M1826_002351 [Phylliscum demangeonii]
MADSEPVDVDMTEAPGSDDPSPGNDGETGGRRAARKHWKPLFDDGSMDLSFKQFMAQPTIQDSRHAPPPAALEVAVEAPESHVPVVRLPPGDKLKRKKRRAEPSKLAERPSKTRTKGTAPAMSTGPPTDREVSTPPTGPTPSAPPPLRPRRAKKDRTTQEDDGKKKGSKKTPAKAAEEALPRRLENAAAKAKRAEARRPKAEAGEAEPNAEHLFVIKPPAASTVSDMALLAAMHEDGDKQNVRLGVTSLMLNDKGGWLVGFESLDAARAALILNPVFTVGKDLWARRTDLDTVGAVLAREEAKEDLAEEMIDRQTCQQLVKQANKRVASAREHLWDLKCRLKAKLEDAGKIALLTPDREGAFTAALLQI